MYLPRGCTCPDGVYLPGGLYLPGGIPAWGVYMPRGGVYLQGNLPRGCTCLGGVPAQGEGCTCPAGHTCQGVFLPRGGTCQGTHPPVNKMTDRCKNITLPQTLFAGGKYSPPKNEVWGKIMFSEAFVSHSVQKGGGVSV